MLTRPIGSIAGSLVLADSVVGLLVVPIDPSFLHFQYCHFVGVDHPTDSIDYFMRGDGF